MQTCKISNKQAYETQTDTHTLTDTYTDTKQLTVTWHAQTDTQRERYIHIHANTEAHKWTDIHA